MKQAQAKPSQRFLLRYFMFAIGPGLVVMLADTDAGSLITAAQSGAVWGYRMLLLMLILIPILFIVQELTLRLGLVTGKGHGELIKTHFGARWAWLSVGTLLLSCIGSMLTEFSGISGVGQLFGIPVGYSVSLVIAFMLIMAWTGSYHSVERSAILIGLFELIFVAVAILAHPHYHEAITTMWNIPYKNSQYWYLASASVGAVIMPWMVFYQQSAVIDKKLNHTHLKVARVDTAIGAIITQVIMASMVVITAATIGKTNPGAPLNTVAQISDALIPFLGKTVGQLLFAMGMLGASLVAAIVVSLTAAWGLGEVTGYKRSLEHRPKEAPWFYAIYSLVLIISGLVVISGINLISLSVAVEVMNAILLPIVLGFLFLLAVKTLPEPYRIKGKYAISVGIILGSVALFGFVSGIWSAF
jgi:Mn2+/Fe2+ NRAMP family transporter